MALLRALSARSVRTNGLHFAIGIGLSHSALRFNYERLLNRSWVSTSSNAASSESTDVTHAKFLAEAGKSDNWHSESNKGVTSDNGDELEGVEDGRGKLSPTSSHLFKLILPFSSESPPTVFLLHPSQPLSHICRLISSALPDHPSIISFRSESEPTSHLDHKPNNHREVQWSDSTDVGDFVKSAARSNQFRIVIGSEDSSKRESRSIEVSVPSFERRTFYLNLRLNQIKAQLRRLDEIKGSCDSEAHRSARVLALGGLAMLMTYWVLIARLTFWDVGWEVMEPVSYLSGLSMVILGYLWFLHQGREVSYSSVLDRSVSARRQKLYQSEGFDLERWSDLLVEEKSIRREIKKIAEDYGIEWGNEKDESSTTFNKKEKDEEKGRR